MECNHEIGPTKKTWSTLKQKFNSTLTLVINFVNESVAISYNFGMVWLRMGEISDLDLTSEVVTGPSKIMIFM